MQDSAKRLLRCAGWWTVVIGQVEMRDAEVECAMNIAS